MEEFKNFLRMRREFRKEFEKKHDVEEIESLLQKVVSWSSSIRYGKTKRFISSVRDYYVKHTHLSDAQIEALRNVALRIPENWEEKKIVNVASKDCTGIWSAFAE